MKNDVVKIIYEDQDLVRLLPVGSSQDISLIPGILAAFEEQYRKRIRRFLLDLSQIDDFSPSLIVLLLELTARIRRQGGEVHVAHLSEQARAELSRFDALDYLQVQDSLEPGPSAGIARPAAEDLAAEAETITIPSRPDVVYKACDLVVQVSRRLGFSENEVNKIKLAVYEACLNVVEHAYHSDPSKSFRVSVGWSAEYMEIQVIDRGDGFEVNQDNFDAAAAAAARQTGGMGLHIIRRSMDKVSYQRNTPEGNKLIMIKRY
jgi:serine/threonine-protein kinase RsbW